jgi:hypothetical protein
MEIGGSGPRFSDPAGRTGNMLALVISIASLVPIVWALLANL